MYKGPNLQQDLQSLLMKWRQYKYAFTADIEKMYRKILVNPEDSPLQRIIWRESTQQPIQKFELSTVTYGTKAAPFLAMMTLRKLAADERESFPNAAKVVEESFYMDDLVHGAHNLEQGQQLIHDLDLLLRSGGFILRKWSSNSQEMLKNIENRDDTQNLIFNFKTETTSKLLGLCWNPIEDKFTFQCQITNPKKLTKRSLLSEISKIFDPLGWLAPVVTKLKLLFQKVWKTNIQWDDEVSSDIYAEWSKLQKDLHNINKCEIPRWILSQKQDVIELHGFCDASMQAYGCVVYARMQHQTKVVLVAGKTRLVPLNKTLTLPRLELSGAHLLSKLIHKIKLALQEHNIITYGWTDSKVVLGWLQGEPSKWKPFVSNRVQQITKVMAESQWRYVKTDDNPADAASRGLYPSQLLDDQCLWRTGPHWLSTFEPERTLKHTFQTDQEEKRRQTNVATHHLNESIIHQLLIKHSSVSKIVRILAWIQRALTPRREHRPNYLTLQELRKAKNVIIRHVQHNEYLTEIKHLRKYKTLNSNSKLLHLHPYIDSDELLRVGGRLEKATISIEMKHPKIIPGGTRLGTLLIEQAHKLTFHGGPRLTSAALRQEYWITGGNNIVKKELRKCVTCRKHEGRTQEQLMGDLPASRTNTANPFCHTGVDYTGFVDVKANKGRGVKTLKGYVAIFVCMVTKAVHLELVSDLTSSAFLAALRRMSARRGAPQHLYSDNGTNFVGANNILQKEWEQLKNIFCDTFFSEVTEMKIEWHFNAPAWPSAGGLWERAVRSLKYHLRRVVGEQKLTFEEYSTILTQIEACLNSRPLCALTENIEDLDFLTPAHFLAGRTGLTIIETPEDARTRWHLTQKITNNIWKRWKAEYLTQLSARRKWQHPQQNIQSGDMVVIHEDNLPSGKWALGRVVETHPGSDGYVRVVTLKTKNGTIKRPITKLSLLPLEKPNETEHITTTTHETETSTSERKKQKQNKGLSYISSVIVFLLCLMAMTSSGHCFNLTPLNEHQAIYFDKLANMQLVRDQWKIIAYYDLEPYWEGITAYEKYYKHLENICSTLQQLTHCDIIMLQLRHTYTELKHNNKVLLNNQLSARTRTKRGVINGVGYLANTLFGVLDDRFSEQYERDITQVRENQKHLTQLWKNQTSVMEAEYNLLKRTEEAVKIQHKTINNHLMSLEQSSNQLARQLSATEVMTKFTLSAMAANNLLTHLKNIQDTLLDTITSIHNGRLNIHLIDPIQFQNELSVISGQLSQELTLPIDNIQTNMQSIYNLLRVRAKMTKNYLIFEIIVPLISTEIYDLYNLIPVPHRSDKSMVTILPIESYVAVNLQKDAYLPVTENELEHCITRDPFTYLCELKTPVYKMKTDTDLCIKDNIHLEHCKTVVSYCQSKWIHLRTQNQYLHFCCEHCQIRILCKDQVTAHQLTGTNIINLKEECVVKTDTFTIYSHKHQESTMSLQNKIETLQIAPINHVINISIPRYNLTEENITYPGHEQLLQDIEQRIEVMKNSVGLSDISTHDIHHYTLIYITLGIVAITATVVVFRRARCGRQPAAETAPSGAAPVHTARSTVEQFSERVQMNECCAKALQNEFKERGTSPVLNKITFSDST